MIPTLEVYRRKSDQLAYQEIFYFAPGLRQQQCILRRGRTWPYLNLHKSIALPISIASKCFAAERTATTVGATCGERWFSWSHEGPTTIQRRTGTRKTKKVSKTFTRTSFCDDMSHFVIQVNNIGFLLDLTKIVQNKLISRLVVAAFTNRSPAKVFKMRTRDCVDIPMTCWIGKINPCNERWTVGSPPLVVEIDQKLF